MQILIEINIYIEQKKKFEKQQEPKTKKPKIQNFYLM